MWFFALPALVINVVIILIPALFTVALAFFAWDGFSSPVFIGLANFEAVFSDYVFWTALVNNIKWTLIFLTVPIAIGLVAATLMLTIKRGRTLFQVIYFLPVVVATAITARVWQGMIYNPSTGVFGLLSRFGIDLPDPLAHTESALYGIAVVDLWHWWGFSP